MSKKLQFLIFQILPILFLFIVFCNCKKNNIVKKDVNIKWENPTDILPGTPLSEDQLDAVADVSGTYVFTPSFGEVLDIGTNQDLEVNFTPDDIENYNTASKIVKINVRQGKSSAIFNNNLTYGTLSDQDGNIYKTITIGTQTWMAENLRVTKYRNGDPIPKTDNYDWSNLTSGAYCNYENTLDIDTISTYGRLYNWYVVNDTRKIEPNGWHIPSKDEWYLLVDYLGGVSEAGSKLKEAGNSHWVNPNEGTNETGFTALPGGHRFKDGIYNYLGFFGIWWSTTEYDSKNAWILYIVNEFTYTYSNINAKECGYSIRCIKD